MTIYVFSGFYALVVVGAKSEERAWEIIKFSDYGSEHYIHNQYKLTNTYEEGEEFIEGQAE